MYKFKATMLTQDHKGMGYEKGRTWNPKGFYYQGNKVIVVGNIEENHTMRLAFPINSVKLEIS